MDATGAGTATQRRFSDLVDRLSRARLRPTRQRLALARLLFEGRHRHVRAEELFEEARADNVRISLATVYNCLRQFTEAGLLREVTVAPGRCYFDTNTADHHHFYREDARTLVDIADDALGLDRVPDPPVGTEISRVDIVLRLAPKNSS